MLRPKDNTLFQGEYAHNWRFIVLDEAHTYSGSTGIEVSMLIRRLKAYLDDQTIQFILTSATLGGEKSNAEAAEFAHRLCNAPFDASDVIRATRVKFVRPEENAITVQSLRACRQCNAPFERGDIKTFLIPEFGFISESRIGKPTLIKPDRTYRTEASMVSKGTTVYQGECKAGSLTCTITSMEDGEIAILNSSSFFVCPSCGYTLADFEVDNAFLPFFVKPHQRASGFQCSAKQLQKYSIGYRFKTDSLSIHMNQVFTIDEAYSVLQAIILSACSVLDIDDTEIDGCLQYTNFGMSYDFVIYDTTPGGAGHVRRISDEENFRKVLAGALDKARNCNCGGEEGDASCYRCLRTYRNQFHHDILRRRYVIDSLSGILEEKKVIANEKISLELQLGDCDETIGNESFDYIISGLNLNDDAVEQRISAELESRQACKPDFGRVDFVCADGAKGTADLVWKNRKVMFFSPANREGYQAAERSEYACFILDGDVNIETVVKAVS